MNPLVAVLGAAVIALLLILFVGAASLAARQRPNIRRLERKIDALLAHSGITLPCKLSSEVQRLASDPHRRIAAIKLHREQTGLSLAEAKADVDDFCD